ncbi:tyrosine-type recombinase/integrase [Tsukamurella pulmonis]|uniref:tyrosine-type recombinase/integrase n=1 Tax=Tsukamurella pulmonis TaxID=47312 RepID=UPI000E099AE5|nr:tyrosine-type recombinase/integrase [Tsukamurella pulmonis]RDH10100.1 integrase [Tsukamurella pulmonis]
MARSFGIIDRRPNGRYRARYTAPDPHNLSGLPPEKRRVAAPGTFATKAEAAAWLAEQHADISRGTWRHPDEVAAEAARAHAEAQRKAITVGEFAEQYIQRRMASGKLGERAAYDYHLYWAGPRPKSKGQRATRGGRLHHFADWPIGSVTYDAVCEWHDAELASSKLTQLTRCYKHLSSVMRDAEDRGLIDRNPCRLTDANLTTGVPRNPPTDAELPLVIDAMPLTLRPLVILAAAVGGRYGELTAFKASDFTVERGAGENVECVRARIAHAVTYIPGVGRSVKAPKTEAGNRTVPFYGDDALVFAAALVGREPDELMFAGRMPTEPLPHSSFTHHWEKARDAAGRPDLQLHALRHYHGTRYAQLSGASLAEVMQRLGHKSVSAAMRYQHAGSRADELARRAAR